MDDIREMVRPLLGAEKRAIAAEARAAIAERREKAAEARAAAAEARAAHLEGAEEFAAMAAFELAELEELRFRCAQMQAALLGSFQFSNEIARAGGEAAPRARENCAEIVAALEGVEP